MYDYCLYVQKPDHHGLTYRLIQAGAGVKDIADGNLTIQAIIQIDGSMNRDIFEFYRDVVRLEDKGHFIEVTTMGHQGFDLGDEEEEDWN